MRWESRPQGRFGTLAGMTKREKTICVASLMVGGLVIDWLLVRSDIEFAAVYAIGAVPLVLVTLCAWICLLGKKPTDSDGSADQ